MEPVSIVSAAAETGKAVLNTANTVLEAVNAVRNAAWVKEDLESDLDSIKNRIKVVQSRVKPDGLPSTRQGMVALEQLQQTLQEVRHDLDEVSARAGAAAASTDQGRLKACWGWCSKWCGACRDAALPPRYQQQLPQLRAKPQEAVEAAEKNGAFTYVQQLQRGLPRLYIRHGGLFQKVTETLCREAAAAARRPGGPGVQGVLITGSRGTGKSTMARDVALGFQADVAGPFPDGIFEAYFGPDQQASDTSVAAMIATQQQLLLNRMKGVESSDLQDVSSTAQRDAVHTQLGNWLCGKRCLLLLDDVRSHQVVSAFNFVGFQGALLVTGLSKDDAWPSAPAAVHITEQHVDSQMDGGPSLAERILASRAANDVMVAAVPEVCKDAATKIIKTCKGNVLALVVMGCDINLRQGEDDTQQAAAQEWRDAADAMQGTFTTGLAEDYATQRPVFGAFNLAVSALDVGSKTAFLALEPFRPGVLIPLPLVRLAVQEYTGEAFDNDAQLKTTLMHAERRGLLKFVQQHSCYQLLDLQAMFLEAYTDYSDRRPSSYLFRTGEDNSIDSTPRQLLAAFLTTYGKNETVLQRAQRFLGLQFNAAGPELSTQVVKVSKLAAGLASGTLQPMSVVAAILERRAWGLYGVGKYEEALQELNRADQLQPGNAAILSSRGAVKRMLGKHEEALQDLNRADELQPDNAFTLRSRGDVNHMLREYQAALLDLDRADQLEPNSAGTLRSRGDVKRMLELDRAALEDLDRADELEPNNAYTLSWRGDVKRVLGQYPEALQDLDRADQLAPNNATTLCWRGDVKRLMGEYEAALQDLNRADELEPNDAFTLERLAAVKQQLAQ